MHNLGQTWIYVFYKLGQIYLTLMKHDLDNPTQFQPWIVASLTVLKSFKIKCSEISELSKLIQDVINLWELCKSTLVMELSAL